MSEVPLALEDFRVLVNFSEDQRQFRIYIDAKDPLTGPALAAILKDTAKAVETEPDLGKATKTETPEG